MARRGGILVAAAVLLSGGGAWTRAEGELFVAETVRYFSTEATTSRRVDFARASTGLYAEYGALEGVTLGFDLDQGGRLDEFGAGAQDGRAGALARARLWTGASGDVVAAELWGTMSLGGLTAPAAGADRSREVRLMALYGRGLETPLGGGWLDAGIGLSKFIGPRADQIRLDLTFGLRPDDKWLAMAQFFGEFGLRDAGPGGSDFDLGKLRLSLGREIGGGKTLLIGLARDVITRGTQPGYELSATLWTSF